MVEGVLQDDAAAHRPADEVRRRDAELLERDGDVVAEVAHAAGRVDRGVLGAAVTTQIDRDNPQVVREVEHVLLPEQRRTRRCRG